MNWWHHIARKRPPDAYIGGYDNPYMRRWWLIPRNKYFNIYLHHFMRSDEDEALHDHPWWNLSILLAGTYKEWTIAAGGIHRSVVLKEGDWKFRFATAAHRIELHAGSCWTLFITGPVLREWGFHCPKGWKNWKDFVNLKGSLSDSGYSSTRGKGCD